MRHIQIAYRPTPILLATAAFSVCTIWLLFGPRTSGAIGRILDGGSGLSLFWILAIIVSLTLSLIFALHAIRILLKLPAVMVDSSTLSIYVFPFKKYRISDIRKISLGDGNVIVESIRGDQRSINLNMLENDDEKLETLLNLVGR